jgi:hypothetical protein
MRQNKLPKFFGRDSSGYESYLHQPLRVALAPRGSDLQRPPCYNTAMTLLRRVGIFTFLLCLVVMAQDKAPTATLNLIVVKEANGKPVKNAEIVLHLLDKEGKQKQDGLELKTHEDGKADTGGIPYGKVRVQVIAQGFRTWGQDIDVIQPSMEITIKLQKPKEQFSIYK